MNQDFVLGNSSGIARRIVKLSTICEIVVDPSVIEKAELDLIDSSVKEQYNLNEIEINAAQSIIDFNFRCVVPGNNNDKVVFAAILSSKIFPIIVYTNKQRKQYWFKFIKNYPELKIDENFFIKTEIDENFITEENRRGVIIIDTHSSYIISSESLSFVMDFERTIIICQNKKPYWIECAEIIFPNSIFDLIKGYVNPYHQKDLATMNFKSLNSNDYLFLFNIVTDLADFS